MSVWSIRRANYEGLHHVNSTSIDPDIDGVCVLAWKRIRQVSQLLSQSDHLGWRWALVLGSQCFVVMDVVACSAAASCGIDVWVSHVHVIKSQTSEQGSVLRSQRQRQRILDEFLSLFFSLVKGSCDHDMGADDVSCKSFRSLTSLALVGLLLLLPKAAQEDLGQVVELGQELVDGISLCWLVPWVDLDQALR
jgi:hypothetical protein